jgi:hypothetical protein
MKIFYPDDRTDKDDQGKAYPLLRMKLAATEKGEFKSLE